MLLFFQGNLLSILTDNQSGFFFLFVIIKICGVGFLKDYFIPFVTKDFDN